MEAKMNHKKNLAVFIFLVFIASSLIDSEPSDISGNLCNNNVVRVWK